MEKIIIAALILTGFFSYACAEQSKPRFSGQDYLNLSRNQRADAIASFVEKSKLRGITIRKNETFYRDKMDIFYAEHPDFIEEALFVVLKTLIVMEYDWGQKGIDKDLLARKWLGKELYQTNKFRLGMGQNAEFPVR